ncbi:hypothetical protein F4777DRAFT_421436 [Nemania sp. FL0916]|nr:hypothetical protein F4777DRAFT_421436 [Nemania sp. FL0916]
MQTNDEPSRARVKLVASTRDGASPSHPSKAKNVNNEEARTVTNSHDDVPSYFESAQWTADGTTLLTYSSTNLVSGYIVPENLLSADDDEGLALEPQAHIQLPEPSNVLAGAPYFSLAEPWTQQLLVSARDHPLQLFYLAPFSSSLPSSSSSSSSPGSVSVSGAVADSHPPIASYPFTKVRSETFLSASALSWPSPGTHFVAGSRSLLARFDVQRPGAEPVARIRTIPSERHLSKGGGVGMRGTVSALGQQPLDHGGGGGSLLAAGTWTRWVGLYDFAQAEPGACVATWGIAAAVRDETRPTPNEEKAAAGAGGAAHRDGGIGGDGITQTVWSPCGRYLVVCERKSSGALIYDVRVTGRLLGYLTGRDALGNQRVACDVFPGTDESGGFEIWSGTSNSAVRVWEGVGSVEGPHAPAWDWAAHQSTVGSACLHPSGTVVATCAGSWEFPDDDGGRARRESASTINGSDSGTDSSEDERPWMKRRVKESSLKIWSITGPPSDMERSS